MARALSALLVVWLLGSCGNGSEPRTARAQGPVDPPLPSSHRGRSPADIAAQSGSFDTYWYRGLAELSRYELSQMRYGERHAGEAVLVFVTEDFRRDRHVKYEGGSRDEVVGVLKLNAHRRFYTGIYPYSVLTSTFTPVGEASTDTLKVSTSVQEWCGHVYAQLERGSTGLELVSHSYFDGEEDREAILPHAPLEDGLWARARRDPSALPEGELSLIPGMHFLRFAHRDVQAERAVAVRDTVTDARYGEEPLLRYRVRYPDLGRTLTLYVEPAFPHGIPGWEEAWERDGRTEVTRAVRTHALMTDYWNHNRPEDAPLREALGLTR